MSVLFIDWEKSPIHWDVKFQTESVKMSMFADMTLQELNALAERQRRQIEEQEKSLQVKANDYSTFSRLFVN